MLTALTPGQPARPCSVCGESPARLFPSGWRCTGHTPARAADRPEPPTVPFAPARFTRALGGPCRYCGNTTYLRDADGHTHACCRAWQRVMSFGYPCPACQVAEIIAKQPPTWPDGRVRQVRLPDLPPLPRTLPDGTPYVPELDAGQQQPNHEG